MTAPMPFLQRLAPAPGAAGKVRAALAPRFAASPAIAEGEDTSVATPAGQRTSTHAADDGLARTIAPAARRGDAASANGPPPRSATVGQPTPMTATDRLSTTNHPPAGPPTRHSARQPSPPMTDVRAGIATTRVDASKLREEPLRKDTRRSELGRVQASAPMARDTPVPVPLRQSVIAQRMASPATPTPTIVHVTIDRIDVRVPSPPAPQRSSPKPRGGTSTVPLADYLRQRDLARGGHHS